MVNDLNENEIKAIKNKERKKTNKIKKDYNRFFKSLFIKLKLYKFINLDKLIK